MASVIDGDSLELHGQQIRLHGIDAPEHDQSCERDGDCYRSDQVAALELADKIDRRPIRCEVRHTDRYGRAVAVCSLDGEDLNGWLVRQGHAVAYRRCSEAYVGNEEAAKAEGIGVWAGDFVMPWRWRRGERL